MASFLDVCRFTPTLGGTTDWTVSTAVTGYQTPALAGAVNAATYRYRAESTDLIQWEIGFGVYTVGTTILTRGTVLFNSSGTGTGAGQSGAGTKINFSTVPQVAIVALAEDLVGTTTNDNAVAGAIGEFISSSYPATAATITVTIASPAVVTYTAHGLLNTNGRADMAAIVFTTTGALPTGIVAGTRYWTIPSTITANTFQIATSIANAIAGTAVNTSGTQSGVHTGTFAAPCTTAAAFDATAISLTAGDWDVWGTVITSPGASVLQTQVFGWTSSVSATVPTVPNGGIYGLQIAFNAASGVYAPVNASRYSLSSTTTVFLSGLVSFSGGANTDAFYGVINARRRR